jgi:hypothetical protein
LVVVGPGEKMVTTRHEPNLLGARGRRDLIEQAGRIAADDLVLFPDQEDELTRVIPEAGDNASGADIPGGSDEQQQLRAANQPAPRSCLATIRFLPPSIFRALCAPPSRSAGLAHEARMVESRL